MYFQHYHCPRTESWELNFPKAGIWRRLLIRPSWDCYVQYRLLREEREVKQQQWFHMSALNTALTFELYRSAGHQNYFLCLMSGSKSTTSYTRTLAWWPLWPCWPGLWVGSQLQHRLTLPDGRSGGGTGATAGVEMQRVEARNRADGGWTHVLVIKGISAATFTAAIHTALELSGLESCVEKTICPWSPPRNEKFQRDHSLDWSLSLSQCHIGRWCPYT